MKKINSMHIKKGDTVIINTGVDKGKKGKVMNTSPADLTITVEGVNIKTKHKKARKAKEQAGIIKIEGPVSVSNANLFCSKCNKATRTAHGINKNGKKVRICKKCGAEI